MSSSERTNGNLSSPPRTSISTRAASYGHSTPVRGHSPPLFAPSDTSSSDLSRPHSGTSSTCRRVALPCSSGSNDASVQQARSMTSSMSHQASEETLKQAPNIHEQSMQSMSMNDSSNTIVPITTKKSKLIYKGQDWKLFRPLHQDRIYHQVILSPEDILEEAHRWVQSFEENPEIAILRILQFFVDVCGNQDLDISSLFNFSEANYAQIRDVMEHDPPRHQQETGKYLMKTASHWGKKMQHAVLEYIDNVLKIAHDNNVLCSSSMVHVFGFAATLSLTTSRALFHTGIVIVARMATVIYEIYVNIKEDIDRCTMRNRADMENKLEGFTLNQGRLRKVLLLLQNVIEKHCCCQDLGLHKMKIMCIGEMEKWFAIDPSIISTTRYCNKLTKLVQDVSKAVRLAAVKTCHKLIKSDEFADYIEPFMEKISTAVCGRIYDMDYSVAVAAVETCTTMLDMCPDKVNDSTRENIIYFVFGKHSPLALAGGKFLIKCLCMCVDEEELSNPMILLEQLIKFVTRSQVHDSIPLLVEAVLDCCEEISNWKLMTNCLLSNKFDFLGKKILIAIMAQAFEQTVTGVSKYVRIKSHRRKVSTSTLQKASAKILKRLPNLCNQEEFKKDPQCLQLLVEMFLFVDFDSIVISQYTAELDALVRVLRPAFTSNTDVKLLETISKVLARLSDDSFILKTLYDVRVSTLKIAVGKDVNEIAEMLDASERVTEDDLQKTERCLLRLSILFEHHDMTDIVTSGTIFDILMTPNDTELPATSMKHVIKSGYWFLIWHLRLIIENGSKAVPANVLKEYMHEFNSVCTSYLDMCFDFMQVQPNEQTRHAAFENVCNLFINLWEELENPIKSNPALEELMPPVREANQLDLLDYARLLVFDDNEGNSLKLQRTSLGYIMSLGLINAIEVLKLVQILKYYASHAENYKDIFETFLQSLRDTDPFALVGMILRTLVHWYTELYVDSNMAPDQTDVDDLRKLSKQFQMFLSQDESQLALDLGKKFALSSEDYYQFLDFVKYFSAALAPHVKQNIANDFTAGLSQEQKNNDAFKHFIWYLKNYKATVRTVAQSEDTESGDSEVEIEVDPSDTSELEPTIEQNSSQNE